ncbi:MAG: hypothetical protein A2075_20230 [Geobacteraceae bacterium GWC2_58_44]|nr:MAG: hypothetical protein A2075_20230 [Geobacteraceae bacterium GWC2_58_44]HBG08323.1 hypothetical protein [Geobacter sp.]
MIRFSHPMHLLTVLALLAMTACCPAGKQFMGDPQNPYPPVSAPKVGDIVHLPTGVAVSLAQMLEMAGDARVVYIGETHDNPASHLLELQTLQGLEKRHPGKVALGMEMFTRSQQPVLDRWVAGELEEKAFIKESRWFDNWKMDFDYYRELLIFARDRHIPIIALNADKSLVQALRSKPLDELSAEEKAQMPEMDMNDPYQRGMAEGIFGGHGHGKMHIESFLRVQTLWDEMMAESAARYLASPAGAERHLLVIAGGNHVSYGFGIPRRVFRRLPASYVMIGGNEIEVSPEKQGQMMDVELPHFPMVPFDFLAFLSYNEAPKQGVLLGVMFEPAPAGRGLLVKNVIPGSNADRAGVKQDDLLLTLDGESLSDSFDLVYAVKKKRVGDRSTLQVERQGTALTLEVLYQADEPDPHGKP